MKKSKMYKFSFDETCEMIMSRIDNELLDVLNVLDLEFDDAYIVIKRLSDEERDMIIFSIINELLNHLKTIITLEKYSACVNLVNKITAYYKSNDADYSFIKEKGNKIADDLLFKIINKNNYGVDFPIEKLAFTNFYLSYNIDYELSLKILVWIIIRYVGFIRCVSIGCLTKIRCSVIRSEK